MHFKVSWVTHRHVYPEYRFKGPFRIVLPVGSREIPNCKIEGCGFRVSLKYATHFHGVATRRHDKIQSDKKF